MRILAIRGKNLASLADNFEVSLETGPLQNAGLFAITGQTGAGKSTILDAMCLALYDQMPRLPDGHSVAIGHKDEDEAVRVKSNDVSSILRRGTASAYAEVDFIGQDKHTYRARWEISRARGKVSGRLQAQKISLQDLQSEEKIGQGKKDTLQEIAKRLGLNFDQFRRSVLLAQGDFAAFLKAKKDERSSLLEKITGTDIYSELSIAAFERTRLEKSHLDRILEKLADKVPLAAEVRAELEQEKQQLNNQLTKLQQDLKDRQKIIAWFETQLALQKEQQDAQEKVQLAEQQWDSHAADRELLLQVELVQPVRPLLQLEQSLVQECEEAATKLSENQSMLQQAEHSLNTVTKRVAELNQTFIHSRKSHTDAQPLLIAARKLDTQIDDSKSGLQHSQATSAEQQEKYQTAVTAYKQFNTQKNQQASKLQELHIWQEQHISMQLLANEWERWEAEIKIYITLDQELQQDTQKLSKLQTNIKQQQNKLQKLQTDSSQALAEKNQLTGEFELLEKQVLALPLTELHQQKSQLESEQEILNATLLLAEKGLAEKILLLQDLAALVNAESSILAAQALIEQLSEQQISTQAQWQEAQQAFNLMQAASEKTAADLRSLLKDQQPCPVCGAQEHPWAALLEPIQQPVSEQQNRVNTLQTEKEQLIKDLTEQQSLLKQADKTKLDLSTRLSEADTLQNTLSEQWSLITLDNKPAWTDIQQSYLSNLSEQIKELKAEYAKAKKQEIASLKQQSKLDDLRSQTENLSQLYAIQLANIAKLDTKLAEQNSTYLAKKQALQRIETEQDKRVEMLKVPFKQIDNWNGQLQQAGDIFLQQITSSVSLWHEKITQQTLIQEQLQHTEKQILAAEPEKTHQQNIYTQYQQDLERQSKQYESLLLERQQYFNGALADDYAANIEKQLLLAENGKQQAEAELVRINTEIKTTHNTVEHWQTEGQRRADKKTIATQELLEAIQAQQISKSELQQLLTKDSAWIGAQKEANQLLSTTRQETQVTLTVKTQSLHAHESDMPKESSANAQEQIKRFVEQQDTLSQAKENNSFALRSDDEKISSGKDLQQQLQLQQQCWEQWESLNELIGSSSGHKFCIFAQGLTLETLLSYTNRHLQEFARRYHLQRVPGSDLELQVLDRDMADEVRSVHSLSGGESFLVSLALALGLASLSSNKTQVESLFIDEGFGSLDQETLDIAIASLDTLQSLGRKVGVISHVAVLVERIGAQVLVEKLGGGKSTVTIRANT